MPSEQPKVEEKGKEEEVVDGKKLDQKFEGIETWIQQLESKFEDINNQLEEIRQKQRGIENDIDNLEFRMKKG